MRPDAKRILVIEDDALFRRVVVRILEKAEYDVIATEHFSSAIEILEGEEHLNLLLTDVRMPAGTPNGITIGRMANLRRSRLPIVYMTGSYKFAQLAGLVETEAAILEKPFSAEELLRTIKAVIG